MRRAGLAASLILRQSRSGRSSDTANMKRIVLSRSLAVVVVAWLVLTGCSNSKKDSAPPQSLGGCYQSTPVTGYSCFLETGNEDYTTPEAADAANAADVNRYATTAAIAIPGACLIGLVRPQDFECTALPGEGINVGDGPPSVRRFDGTLRTDRPIYVHRIK